MYSKLYTISAQGAKKICSNCKLTFNRLIVKEIKVYPDTHYKAQMGVGKDSVSSL